MSQRNPEHERSALQELARRELARRSLKHFIPRFFPDMTMGWFNEELYAVLEQFIRDVELRLSPRLLISAPPRHGKSVATTRGLTPWVLGSHPNWETIVATSTQDLANYFGVEVRRIVNDPEYQAIFPELQIDKSSNAVDHMATLSRGGYKLIGVGGGLPGRGANILVADDLVASRADAQSTAVMERIWTWFNSVAMNRLQPGGGAIVMNTRWEIDDVIGRIKASDAKGRWKEFSYPALAEEDEPHRKKGEALIEHYYPRRMLEEERDRLIANGKERDWCSLFQQRPTKESGDFFKSEYLSFIPIKDFPAKKDLVWYIGTDFAASVKKTADKTALVPFGVDKKGDIYLAQNAVLARMESQAVVNKLVDLIEEYKPMFVGAEKGPLHAAYGPLLRDTMRARRAFATIEEIGRSQEKYVYATPVQARMQQRRVHFPDNLFYRTVVAPQFLNFVPGNQNQSDDFIDALSNGMAKLNRIMSAPPVPMVKEKTKEEEEKEHWDKVARNSGGPTSKVPFLSLTGKPIT